MADAVSDGYAIERTVLSGAECDVVLNALVATKSSRAGKRHLMSNAAVAALASDPRLTSIAKLFTGAEPTPFRATLFEKNADANWLIAWHQDTALPLAREFEAKGWGPWSVKSGVNYAKAPAWALARVIALRVHLDESNEHNGPLRVIPGSHRFGLLTDLAVRAQAVTQRPTTCLLPRGSVLAMRPLLLHASSKARSEAPRRVLHIEYADSLDFANGIRLAVA